jgi:hypothetical protein
MLVSVNELKRLLFTIFEGSQPTHIRYRLLGQLWHPNFLRVVKISNDPGVVFYDPSRNTLLSLADLSSIIQFELDCPLHSFQPNFHYQVTPNENYKLVENATKNHDVQKS